MPRNTRPGKFEGEQDYAEHFYQMSLEGADEEVEIDGVSVSIFDVWEDDVAKFPELAGRPRVAFYESDQGFWTELDMASLEAAIAEDEELMAEDGYEIDVEEDW